MRRILSLLVIFILISCRNTEQARIDSIEDCFNVKIPECRTLIRNDYEAYGSDYSFELELHFDSNCFKKLLAELPNANANLESTEKAYDTYQWRREDGGENATLLVFYTEQDLIFIFNHL